MMKKEYKISEKTQNLLSCIEDLNTLYDKVYDSLCQIYPENTVQQLMEIKYTDKHNELRNVIENFTMDSIRENLYNQDTNFI